MALWLLVAHGSANVGRVRSAELGVHADFETFHRSALALLRGEPIYDTGASLVNLNPPVWTVLMAPLGLVPPLTAYWVFGVLTAVLVVGAGLLVARELGVPVVARVLVSVAVLVSSPLMGTFALGQVYGVLAAGIAVAWVLRRRGRLVAAGVLLGVVIAIKPTLAPLLLWPAAGRSWRMLAAAIGGAVAATLTGLIAGPGETWRWVRIVWAEPFSTFGDNASLPSFVARLDGPAWIGYLAGAVLVAVTVRRIAVDRADVWALTAATLLLSPVAWHNYLVLCFPGVFLLVRAGRTAAAALLLALPLIGVEWGMHLWLGDTALDRLGRSLYCAVLLTWWAVLTFADVRPAAPAAPPAAAETHPGTAVRPAGS